jgi:hypothetical protein
MKVIVFTMTNGAKLDFTELTGLANPKDESLLELSATTAMSVDDQIESYEIEDRA